MLDITFKSDEGGVYELKARFGKDVDPDALLTSIGSFIEMVKTAPSVQGEMKPNVSKPSKKEPDDLRDGALNMSSANKALLVSLHEYEQEREEPVDIIWDIREYALKYKAYADFVKGKSRKQEVISLRYQLRLFREKLLLEQPPNRALTPLGVEIAQQVKSSLKVVVGYVKKEQGSSNEDEERAFQEPLMQNP